MAQRGDSGESKTKTVLREGEIEMYREGIEQIMNTKGGESKKEGLRAGDRGSVTGNRTGHNLSGSHFSCSN